MVISERGVAFIRSYEKFVARSYPDPGSADGNPWTIGYGSTRYEDGAHVKKGEVVTEEKALSMLRQDLAKRSYTLTKAITSQLNQNQVDAVISLAYNIGLEAFLDSSFLKLLNKNPNSPLIQDQFLEWTHNDGKVMLGLVKRRSAEWSLYNQPYDK